MRLFLALLLLASLCSASYMPNFMKHRFKRFRNRERHFANSNLASVPTQYFDQVLDHFSRGAKQPTWKQRYWVDDSLYTPGAPIFVQLGEEAASSSGYASGMQMASYAKEYGALLVAIEHRFYGESQPTGDLSTESLRLLNVDQGIADFARVIDFLKQKYAVNATSQPHALIFGCSYIGAGASWMRTKYPFSVAGAVASSAPVLAVVDMVTYLGQVGKSIREQFGEQCDAALVNATMRVAGMINSTSGKQQLKEDFLLCDDINTVEDAQTFWSGVSSAIMGVVQYDAERPGSNIPAMCQYILAEADPYVGLAKFSIMSNGNQCSSVSYKDMIQQLQSTDTSNGIRPWLWQTAAEFGYYQSTDGPSPLSYGNMVPVSYYLKLVNDMFGINIDVASNVAETNIRLGGNKLPPYTISNVIFDNSIVDPWHTLSVQADVNPTSPLILYDGEGHCAAVEPSSPNDPPSLTLARKQIALGIERILQSIE